MILSSTPVICAAPSTFPQTNKLSLMLFTMRLAKGAPLAVGTDMSTIQCFKFVNVPPEVARDALDGSMICTFV
jgi:hypothetical protein